MTFVDHVDEQRWETGYLCRNYCAEGQLYGCELAFDEWWVLMTSP